VTKRDCVLIFVLATLGTFREQLVNRTPRRLEVGSVLRIPLVLQARLVSASAAGASAEVRAIGDHRFPICLRAAAALSNASI
jgi:hypothetical protein